MGSISSIQGQFPRFGHGNSRRHIHMLEGDWRREYHKLKRLNSPKVQGLTEEQFVEQKRQARGKKDWRK